MAHDPTSATPAAVDDAVADALEAAMPSERVALQRATREQQLSVVEGMIFWRARLDAFGQLLPKQSLVGPFSALTPVTRRLGAVPRLAEEAGKARVGWHRIDDFTPLGGRSEPHPPLQALGLIAALGPHVSRQWSERNDSLTIWDGTAGVRVTFDHGAPRPDEPRAVLAVELIRTDPQGRTRSWLLDPALGWWLVWALRRRGEAPPAVEGLQQDRGISVLGPGVLTWRSGRLWVVHEHPDPQEPWLLRIRRNDGDGGQTWRISKTEAYALRLLIAALARVRVMPLGEEGATTLEWHLAGAIESIVAALEYPHDVMSALIDDIQRNECRGVLDCGGCPRDAGRPESMGPAPELTHAVAGYGGPSRRRRPGPGEQGELHGFSPELDHQALTVSQQRPPSALELLWRGRIPMAWTRFMFLRWGLTPVAASLGNRKLVVPRERLRVVGTCWPVLDPDHVESQQQVAPATGAHPAR